MLRIAVLLIALGVAGAEAAENKSFTTEVIKVHREVGMASFYSGTGRTASGMKSHGMTAAHRRLPFGSRVKVRDVKTGREVTVVIVDRGPFIKSRVIDLSQSAAKELGITGRGIARVEVVAHQ
jgi:rare lipoprotein A